MDEQHERDVQQRELPQLRRRPRACRGDREIDRVVAQPLLHLRLIAGVQAEAHVGIARAHPRRHRRQVIAQHEFGAADAQFRFRARAQFIRERAEIFEKRLDVREQLFARGREPKRAALEKFRPRVLLELAHLSAHRRLLDAIGNLSDGRTNTAVLRDVVEQLEMVDVHRSRRE